MKFETIQGENGYAIPCLHTLTGADKTVCIVSHGFGSSKSGQTQTLLEEAFTAAGIGFFAYDFPGHGDSEVDGSALRVGNCLADLASAETFVRQLAPGAEIVYFGSSFGAYITLLYLSLYAHAGRKAVLRSAAVDMRGIFDAWMQRDGIAMPDCGWFEYDLDFYRPVKITKEFLDDLRKYDLFRICRKTACSVRMLHGERDELASPEAARRFADTFAAQLTLIPDGDHRLSIPGAPERVLAETLRIFQ
ncbi:MAG: alpha/beta hydrolase [Oscillospiraceae bacterium]|jgi:pimeloyl-ACP methyl ester carboxylesterase